MSPLSLRSPFSLHSSPIRCRSPQRPWRRRRGPDPLPPEPDPAMASPDPALAEPRSGGVACVRVAMPRAAVLPHRGGGGARLPPRGRGSRPPGPLRRGAATAATSAAPTSPRRTSPAPTRAGSPTGGWTSSARGRRPLPNKPKLHVQVRFAGAAVEPRWGADVVGAAQYPCVPQTFFKQRQGCRVSLYQDAHVPDAFRPSAIRLADGRAASAGRTSTTPSVARGTSCTSPLVGVRPHHAGARCRPASPSASSSSARPARACACSCWCASATTPPRPPPRPDGHQ